eukprot:1595261-Rhodomonas_salina.1
MISAHSVVKAGTQCVGRGGGVPVPKAIPPSKSSSGPSLTPPASLPTRARIQMMLVSVRSEEGGGMKSTSERRR